MKAVYTCLGFVSEMRYTDKKKDEYILEFTPKRSWNIATGTDSFLMIAKGQNHLVFVPWSAKRAKVPTGGKAQKKIYRNWSGYETSEAFEIKISEAKQHLIGHIKRIEYTSDKFEASGDRPGVFHIYRHNFKKPQRLYTNKQNTIFAIRSAQTLHDYRGIIG